MASAMVTTTTATTLLLPFSSSSSTRTSLTVVPLASCSSSSSSFSSPSKADPFNVSLSWWFSVRATAVIDSPPLVSLRSSPIFSFLFSSTLRSSIVASLLSSTLRAAPKQKIRIKLRSYWVPLIEQACQQILEAARNSNSQTMGPVPLPTKKRVYCVLRSPHVNKDSREHFEIRTHRRLIDLENPNAQTIDALMQLDLPAGVDVEVKLS
ncbi:unnamed protein product [Sphagnum troendelagicum]